MALSARHRWCTSKLVEAFAPAIDDSKAQAFIRQEDVHQKFSALFRGEPGIPVKLLVYFQPPSSCAPLSVGNSTIPSQDAPPSSSTGLPPRPPSFAAGDPSDKPASPPVLFLAESDCDADGLEAKCCYFLRTVPQGQAIDINKEWESDLLFGEVSSYPLKCFENLLSHAFKPLLEAADTSCWGKADEENKGAILEEMDHLIYDLNEALKSVAAGLELRRPEWPKTQELDTFVMNMVVKRNSGRPYTYHHLTSHQSGLLQYFQGLVEGWCDQIEAFLDVPPTAQDQKVSSTNQPMGAFADKALPNVLDEGPKGELDRWKNRTQRLTSVTQQLRRKDVNTIMALLTSCLMLSPLAGDLSHTTSSTLNGSLLDPSAEGYYRNSTQSGTQVGGAGESNTEDSGTSTLTHKLVVTLRRWKQIDVSITEAASEAKDNVKYLATLEKFIGPLYSGTPTSMLNVLPALMGSLKMIHTISRYYNTTERMTALFQRVTDQMVRGCKTWLLAGGSIDALWDRNPQELIGDLESCLRLKQGYQEQYTIAKTKLHEIPKGKQFDFDEGAIFGRFEAFGRRLLKLIELFTTLDQFLTLTHHKLEGIDGLISQVHDILKDFRTKRHDLLDYQNTKFDRALIDFQARITDLEAELQAFINQSFENITSIEHALELLDKFQNILQRESLRSDLDSKLSIIFQNYGMDLEHIQQLYEKQKFDPPIARNLPPVAGNIAWARHLYQRIESPMRQFYKNQNVLAGKEAKKIIKMYNKIARTLITFEFRWHEAWIAAMDQAKSGLHATLITRRPDDSKLIVNFNHDIMQLIREAKCLDRMGGLKIPESANIILYQNDKFKKHYDDLRWLILEYQRIVTRVIPVTALALRPHFMDMELTLRPGMTTLTWTSMNIAAYIAAARVGLDRLDALVGNVNDVIENRVEKTLKIVSKTSLVDLPEGGSFTVEEFVKAQETHVAAQSQLLETKNVEIQHAVDDLVSLITTYSTDHLVDRSKEKEEVLKLRRHYNYFMFQALLHCAKNSMNALKKRIAPRILKSTFSHSHSAVNSSLGATQNGIYPGESSSANGRVSNKSAHSVRPFFEVNVHLNAPSVILQPSLNEIQGCINKSAQAILRCFTKVHDWPSIVVGAHAEGGGLDDNRTEEASHVEGEEKIYLMPGSPAWKKTISHDSNGDDNQGIVSGAGHIHSINSPSSSTANASAGEYVTSNRVYEKTLASSAKSHCSGTFFERVTRDIEIVRVALLLMGCIQGVRNTVQNYLSSFGVYDWLWRDDKDLFYKNFVSQMPSLEVYKEKLEQFDDVEADIEAISSLHNIGALSLDTSSLKLSFKNECGQWKMRFASHLHVRAKEELERLTEYIRVTMSKLTTRSVDDLDTLRSMMVLLEEVRAREAGIEMEMDPILSMYTMLESFLPSGFIEKEEIDKITVLRSSWKRLLKQASTRTDELVRRQAGFKRGLIRDIRAFTEDVALFRRDFLSHGPMVQGVEPMIAVERLKRFKEEFKIRERKYNLYHVGESIFHLEATEYPELKATEKELKLLDQLYGLYTEVLETVNNWSHMSWNETVPQLLEFVQNMETFSMRTKKLPTRLRDWEAFKQLRQRIEDYQMLLPLLQELSKESLRKRHWEEVATICGVPFRALGRATTITPANDVSKGDNFAPRNEKIHDDTKTGSAQSSNAHFMAKENDLIISSTAAATLMRQDSDVLIITEDFPGPTPLGDILKFNLLIHKEEIEEITDGADKQRKIERELKDIAAKWIDQCFTFQDWKNRGVMVLKGTASIMEELEESQMRLQQMLTQRHVQPFRGEAQDRLNTLSDVSYTLERWIRVQVMWCSLESVFMGGDIAKQMPTEAKKFAKIDKDWSKMMSTSFHAAKVVEATSNEGLKATLPVMHTELEKCQKSLEGYLEQKRNKFPRFFFVSNPGLLAILSQGSDSTSMNDHYEKVFDAVETVDHNKKDKSIIEAINGDDQKVPIATSSACGGMVRAVGNIEDWLADLLKKTQLTMKDLCRTCAIDIHAQVGNDITQLRKFVDSNIAQFALLGIQLLWTMDCQTALETCKTKKHIMKETNQKQLAVLQEMSSWCLQDLGSKANRRKIETLVTIYVHQRDVMADLTALYRAKKIKDANDFEWLKQARFYWRPNSHDECDADGACVVSITDVDFNYQYEYLGAKERLVVTPLTDRCYITLAQALGMYFGGAPAGPAGTGKTETVKDLGRTLGLFVVVTNCTDQQKYTDCAKIFKGLCQGGLWGCFDEFNRILLPVLSVVAQQVLAIQNAKKAGVEYFQFPGDSQNVLLKPCCGFFITMNPGYAGRQELPENLKALFRGVAMMTPDFQIIKKVKLCSVGYTDFDLLAQKFFVLYSTCREQLSAQKHYDWGLRNILAVLRTAGQTKRDNVDKSESYLMYRTLRDMNLSKLVAQDVPLFLSLLADLFPTIQAPPKGEYPEMENLLRRHVEREGLVYHPGWVGKCVQLYETTLVRHGIMLVGAAGGGKTKMIESLAAVLTDHTGKAHKLARFNPKALRAPEMYGEIDPLSGEWTTGVFAAMWAKYNNRLNNYNTWIVADGPVDAIWIEDLNTVLDDNKLLTLANGDRIPMTDNVKLMFEVESLVNASPATVSRAGIIYVSDTDLDWAPVLKAWIRKRPVSQQTVLRDLQKKWLGDNTPTNVGHCIEFLSRHTTMVLPSSRVGMVTSLCDLFAGLTNAESGGVDLTAEPFVAPEYGLDADNGNGDSTTAVTDSSSHLHALALAIEKLFIYSLCWSLGALLEQEDRVKFHHWLAARDTNNLLPTLENVEDTVYEYYVNLKSLHWEKWRPPIWTHPLSFSPGDSKLDFSNLLIPTMDSTRANYLMQQLHKQRKSILVIGAEGTAKTSTNLMFLKTLPTDTNVVKRINFSSATTPFMCQQAIETELDKRGGRSFGPPGGKRMTIFMDDISMPEKNEWGDQPTLEMVRLVMESACFPFLDKDKRGEFKLCEDLQFLGAMGHPGGGKNDIPNRLKRNFFMFNLVLPTITSINDIYGQMLSMYFGNRGAGGTPFDEDVLQVVPELTKGTISLWKSMKDKMLPTPAKFHYSFNMRELSRVFQGLLLTPKTTFLKAGNMRTSRLSMTPAQSLVGVWRHECERVFCDKLTNNQDKEAYVSSMEYVLNQTFPRQCLPPSLAPGKRHAETSSSSPITKPDDTNTFMPVPNTNSTSDASDDKSTTIAFTVDQDIPNDLYMVNFMRDDIYDEDGVLQEEAPKIYEAGGSLSNIRKRVEYFARRYNEDFPSRSMNLVFFDDALKHLLRLNRLLEMPRGSALLVGVGGSGKQSLTRLAAYISRATCFQITLTKTYNLSAFMDDLRFLYKSAGQLRKQTVFLFTESEIKDEVFLELINSILTTGEVPGLFAKEEYMAMSSDLRAAFLKERPDLEETPENMKQFFIDTVRDNLHLVLCMSPLNPKFATRARKFPGLISGPTIDWFLPWPEEALVSVSRGLMRDFPIDCTPEVKENLMVHMGMVHKIVTDTCEEYFLKMRRRVYQTPKSYLSFIQNFKLMYGAKLKELQTKEERVNLGLRKLIDGAKDVAAMKTVLAEEQGKLEVATLETDNMLASLEISSAEAQKEGDQVASIKVKCEEDAARIAAEKAACEQDLAKAEPFVKEAETAIASIKPAHIGEIKKLPNPSDIIKLVFDGVLILFQKPLQPARPAKLNVAKKELPFIETSFKPYAMNMLNDSRFLQILLEFGQKGKDKINEETIEFLQPYMELEHFNPAVAKNASTAAEGLCTWVRAMTSYHEASKVVKPKLEALSLAQAQMDAANKALSAAESRLNACRGRLNELQEMFEAQMAGKRRIEEGALMLQRKMHLASELINGLAGERLRWTEDANNFAEMKRRLVGDCAVACAFVSYCGPFNQQFRRILIKGKFRQDCEDRGVPVTSTLDDETIIHFLADVGTLGDWSQEGLPQDTLSIQNGILVTRCSRYPLLVDPQAQALGWIRNREQSNLPSWQYTSLNDPRLRDKLEYCLGEGKTMIIAQVAEEIDPILDPVLERQVVVKGKKQYIVVADKMMDFNPRFCLYFITRLANPNFAPELQAKTTVVDFTVTQYGLEEQLLGKVIAKEQKVLEEQLSQVLEEVNSNRKALLELDASLLERLTSNTGNLLEDDELIGVLASTKAKAADVNAKLVAADETRNNINEKREQYRKVAERGSVLYFSIVEMSMINCMYQTSLDHFLALFMEAMDKADRAALASKRVQNIIDVMTYTTYRYINRGLYERDKLTFIMILTLKILITAKILRSTDFPLFLRGGAALDINQVERKPFPWMTNESWLNVVELSDNHPAFKSLIADMVANQDNWRRWYEDNEPEELLLPDDYDARLNRNTVDTNSRTEKEDMIANADTGCFLKLLLVRMLRMDRCIISCKKFVRQTRAMGPRYVEPVNDTIESIYQDMVPHVPVIFLLSVGSDPTDAIETLARRKKLPPPAIISLGEGQEQVAIKAFSAAAQNGTWVLLQNCELGIPLMVQMEDLLTRLKESMDPNFRLFITALPSPEFPLGLLQLATKVTNEPPAGMKAGLLRSYNSIVDQDRLERIESLQWRQLLFALCFLHSTVQERRKFGPLGWSIPYEYNHGDLTACILFLEKHLYSGTISWATFQYMVSEVQYGGKVTDNMDRRLLKTYTQVWLNPQTCDERFSYNPSQPLLKIPEDFNYRIGYTGMDIQEYRKYVNQFPEVDSPEIFGLHPNADLTFRVKEVSILFNTLGETQPKGSVRDGMGYSREQIIFEKATELLARLPEEYNEDDYRAKLAKQGGLTVPLNIFLFQEIQRMQRIISKVKITLQQLQLAIKGEVVMSEELASTLLAVYDAKVPHSWVFTVAGDEFSWILPTLGLWFSSLLQRDEQLRTWLNHGRPNSYWLPGFSNPQGLLTAMKQEVTRRHKADKWALDDVVYHTEVTSYERPEQIRSPPSEGIYVYGLSLEGAGWNKIEGTLVESEAKKLFVPLPVLHVTANTKSEEFKVRKDIFGTQGPYEAPCYKYPCRTDRFMVMMVTLKGGDRPPTHWALRGTALLCNIEG